MNRKTFVTRFIIALSMVLATSLFLEQTGSAQVKKLDFSHEIVPILRARCAECHAGNQKKGGFSINTRVDLMQGSENGAVIDVNQPNESRLLAVIRSDVEGERMPPEGPRLTREQTASIEKWLKQGVEWEDGFAFKSASYEPPLLPRSPELPPAIAGRGNPIDRIIDNYVASKGHVTPAPVSDSTFVRRIALDLVGLLPAPEQQSRLESLSANGKREQIIDELLSEDVAYAEHWLTFWNDLLRNDYDGTGFITGGRKQISGWLYDSLINNKPYNQMVRELIAPPSDASRGFIEGIKWRGEVSAGQTVEIQFAQSVGQSLLGINLKCASCHDSFIDRWKLDEAYSLAAIYSAQPLEIHRCDKAVGRKAQAAWLFPELGQVDPEAPPAERLKQLAELMVHPQNGRFARTIVNRLWHRMMGRGIVHPTDAMQTEPWNEDLLDYLATDFVSHNYNLKHTLKRIATSAAYQSKCELLDRDSDTKPYVYAGPRARRMTAEQFIDAVWQLTGAAPTKMDANVLRGKFSPELAKQMQLTSQWIWAATEEGKLPAAGEKYSFQKTFQLDSNTYRAVAVISCDNRFTVYINNKKLATSDNWKSPVTIPFSSNLKKGDNEILVVAGNDGSEPNPAGLFFEARISEVDAEGSIRQDVPAITITSDETWDVSSTLPAENNGKFAKPPTSWSKATLVANQKTWDSIRGELRAGLARGQIKTPAMVRAALLKSDPLMRSLGRPNRDQIVSMRPNEMSTLEAIDLANGTILAKAISSGAENLLEREWKDTDSFTSWLIRASLCREATDAELKVGREIMGNSISQRGIEDLLWVVIMLPEFQIVR